MSSVDDVTFSILLPTRNRPKFLRRAVQSILEQDHMHLELIIKDGGDRLAALDLPDDHRIIYVHSADASLAGALNMASSLATGDIWHWASDDDVMEPGALSHVAAHIGAANWLYGAAEIVENGVSQFRVGGAEQTEEEFAANPRCPQPAVYWRRDLFQRFTQYWKESAGLAVGPEMWARFRRLSVPKVIPTVLASYTFHDEQMSVLRHDEQAADWARVLEMGVEDVALETRFRRELGVTA